MNVGRWAQFEKGLDQYKDMMLKDEWWYDYSPDQPRISRKQRRKMNKLKREKENKEKENKEKVENSTPKDKKPTKQPETKATEPQQQKQLKSSNDKKEKQATDTKATSNESSKKQDKSGNLQSQVKPDTITAQKQQKKDHKTEPSILKDQKPVPQPQQNQKPSEPSMNNKKSQPKVNDNKTSPSTQQQKGTKEIPQEKTQKDEAISQKPQQIEPQKATTQNPPNVNINKNNEKHVQLPQIPQTMPIEQPIKEKQQTPPKNTQTETPTLESTKNIPAVKTIEIQNPPNTEPATLIKPVSENKTVPVKPTSNNETIKTPDTPKPIVETKAKDKQETLPPQSKDTTQPQTKPQPELPKPSVWAMPPNLKGKEEPITVTPISKEQASPIEVPKQNVPSQNLNEQKGPAIPAPKEKNEPQTPQDVSKLVNEPNKTEKLQIQTPQSPKNKKLGQSDKQMCSNNPAMPSNEIMKQSAQEKNIQKEQDMKQKPKTDDIKPKENQIGEIKSNINKSIEKDKECISSEAPKPNASQPQTTKLEATAAELKPQVPSKQSNEQAIHDVKYKAKNKRERKHSKRVSESEKEAHPPKDPKAAHETKQKDTKIKEPAMQQTQIPKLEPKTVDSNSSKQGSNPIPIPLKVNTEITAMPSSASPKSPKHKGPKVQSPPTKMKGSPNMKGESPVPIVESPNAGNVKSGAACTTPIGSPKSPKSPKKSKQNSPKPQGQPTSAMAMNPNTQGIQHSNQPMNIAQGKTQNISTKSPNPNSMSQNDDIDVPMLFDDM